MYLFQIHFISSLTTKASNSVSLLSASTTPPFLPSHCKSHPSTHVYSIFCFSTNFLPWNFLFSSKASLKNAHHSSRSIPTLLAFSKVFFFTTHQGSHSLPPQCYQFILCMPAFPTILNNLEAERFHSSFKFFILISVN